MQASQTRLVTGLCIVLMLIPDCSLISYTPTEHQDAVADFSNQVSTSIGTTLVMMVHSSNNITQQTSSVWLFTGAAVSDLSSLNSWTTELLEDFHTNSQIATLRFATSDGSEQSVNWTASGMGVLSRNSTSATSEEGCMKYYLADGITS